MKTHCITWDEIKALAVKSSPRLHGAREYICADKRAYQTMESAKRAFTRYKKSAKNWIPQVPYRCDVCKKWHLTKK